MRVELVRMGHEATICPDGATAIAALEMNSYDCILVDLNMPKASGFEVIEKAKQLSPETEAVVLTGNSTLESAIQAMRQGVFDYLTKPYRLAELQSLLERVADKRELTNKCRALRMRVDKLEGKSQLIGNSPGMDQV
ncbi:MAG TPA: response regulator, partial [Pirellulales bacterium]|nr:response regulator [Pirellulales bacterium]